MLNCYLLTQTVLRMKSNWKIFMKNSLSTRFFFDFSNFSKDSKLYDNQNEMVFGKMKVVNKEIPINKFVGLKSKMHSMLSDNGKESNTAKGVNTATEFNEFKDTLFNKKVLIQKMKRIQSKNINLEHAKSTKNHCRVLMTKDLY